MKLFIRQLLLILTLLWHSENSAAGIRIYYKGAPGKVISFKLKKEMILRGVPHQFISIKENPNPCLTKSIQSFLDLCVGDEGEVRTIRKTMFFTKTLKPFLKKGLEDNQNAKIDNN